MRPAALLLLLSCATPAPTSDDRPNILFILTDDHRPDGVGCAGNGDLRTPHLDRLAAEGAFLEKFYLAAPLCCPSRAAFLSGLYPHQNGVPDNRRKPDLKSVEPTIAQALGKVGYATGFVGKSHMGGDPRRWGFGDVPLWFPGGSTGHLNPKLMVDGVEKEVPGRITTLFMDASLDWIGKRGSEPWFLWLATTAPHGPYLRDPAHPYRKEEIQAPPMWPKSQPLGNFPWDAYYSDISMLDGEIGRVIERLRATGRLDRTLVFVAGDNGMMQGSHGHAHKQVWFEESVRSFAIARWPAKIRPGTRVASPVSSVDLYATLCDVTGAARPARMEAVSMLPALEGREPLRKAVYSEVRAWAGKPGELETYWQMVRSGRTKYVRLEDGREILYDLERDPEEMKDLSGDPASAGALGEMRALHRRWLEATPYPHDEASARGVQKAWAEALGVPLEKPGAAGLTLVLVPPGTFSMGSPENEPGRKPDEALHSVTLTRPFYLAKNEVTVGQFRKFVEETGYVTDVEKKGGGNAHDAKAVWKHTPGTSWRKPGYAGAYEMRDDHPVVHVSYTDAREFCRWLGKDYRLPTEAEWEWACRAGSPVRFWWGADEDATGKVANAGDRTLKRVHPEWPRAAMPMDDGHAFAAPVGSYRANAFGLHDMLGNVWEFCGTRHGAYPKGPSFDPGDLGTQESYDVRGGGWSNEPHDVRCAARNSDPPHFGHSNLGFRVALSLP